MGKTVEDICNLITEKSVYNLDFEQDKKIPKTLSSCIAYSNPYSSEDFSPLYNYDGLYNPLERTIIQKLAHAIDENSALKVKKLKKEYGNLKEFSNAKKFLNNKCKEVWNVYEPINNLPKNAMKALGITNEPDLDFLLNNSIKYYEKDNSETTAYIIASILKNKNMSYTMDDIHTYLKKMNKQYDCKLNLKTVQYLILEQKYTKAQLNELGINNDDILAALKFLPFKIRLKFDLDTFIKTLKFVHK